MNVLDAALKRVAADLERIGVNWARRPQDYDDLTALTAVADDDDVATARQAVALIEERGFARDRDLAGALAELLTQ